MTAGTMAGFAALADPIGAAAQSVGVKPADLPDLTIKEVKVYVTDLGNYHSLNGERGELVSVVTNSGIEGNYTLGNRNPTVDGWIGQRPRWWGKSVMDVLPVLTSTSGMRGTYGLNGALYSAPGATEARTGRAAIRSIKRLSAVAEQHSIPTRLAGGTDDARWRQLAELVCGRGGCMPVDILGVRRSIVPSTNC